mgnify:CR=1|jgi:hypothetical protein|tara:strand:+ start:2693 stop:3187 length:495 start_codon:yes stop_codon:yes gene_type:complete
MAKGPGEGKYYDSIPRYSGLGGSSVGNNRVIPKWAEDAYLAMPDDNEWQQAAQEIARLTAMLTTSGFGIPAITGMYGEYPDIEQPTRLGRDMDQSDGRRMALETMMERFQMSQAPRGSGSSAGEAPPQVPGRSNLIPRPPQRDREVRGRNLPLPRNSKPKGQGL